jgi:glycosyltransferase involved in cell wall biosynthesis
MVKKVSNLYPRIKSKVRVIPNSYAFGDAPRRKKEEIILHVGNEGTYNGKLVKGTDILIKAYAALPISIRSETKLIIAGNYSSKDRLLHGYEHISNIVFTGKIEHKSVLDLMRRSKLFVLPSRNEAFGQVFIEAMQYGCSLIGTENTGAVDIIESGLYGRIVPKEDCVALASAMSELLLNYDYDKATQAYSNKRKLFSRENWIDSMVNIIHS